MRFASRRTFLAAAAAAFTLVTSSGAWASANATKEEAVAMVKKAIATYKSQGKDKLVADVNAKAPQFFDRDLYIYVASLDGVAVAHAANPKLVGKSLSALKDADGVAFVEKIMDIGKAGKSGWVDYKWPNPVTKQIDEKTTYVETHDGLVFCAGVYR